MKQLFSLFTRPLLAGVLLGATLGLGSVSFASAQAPARPQPGAGTRLMPGVLVFKLKPEVKRRATEHRIEHAALAAALTAVGGRELRQSFPRAVPAAPERAARGEGVDLTLVYRLRYDARQPLEQVKQRLLASGAVAYVEPLYERAVCFQPNDPLADSTLTTGQYALKKMQAYRAWDIEQGDTTVVIGIVDTGTLFSHQDLQGQFAYNYADPINGLDDDNDGYVDNFRGWDTGDNDNNPSVDDSNVGNPQPKHGVLVCGVAGARANNGKGIAGVGYQCRILPIKAYPTNSAGGFAGFEGIVYAADHGCKVINCSWGGPGAYSQFEQDVITYATVNRDAVVVAAAGNTPADLDFYPASYAGVLSVASVDRNDVKGASNTWSKRVSLCAPGRQVYTTHFLNDSTYVTVGGSSFAAPNVAGTAALVRSHFPSLTAAQVAERVRMTADTSIYQIAANVPYREMLGRGRVNARRAVGEADVRSVRADQTHFNRAKPYYAGDTLLLWADFRNYLAPLTSLTVTLTSASSFVQVLQPTFSAGPMATLATQTNAAQPFRVVLLPNAPLNAVVQLRYGFQDASGYADQQYVRLEVNPDYVTLDANRVTATVTSRSNIGFDNGDPRRGDGVALDRGDQLLSEAGLLIGRDANRVSDMIRSATAQPDADFEVVQQVRLAGAPNHPFAAQVADGIFQDTAGPAQADVRVIQRAWETTRPGADRVLFLEYAIVNQAPDTMRTGYAGVFTDWDIRQYEHDASAWDATRRLAYAYNVRNDSVYAGLKLLSGPGTVYAFDNFNPGAPINTTDGLSTAEKYAALNPAPGAPQTAGVNGAGTDVAHLVSARLPTLAPGDTARLAWAIVLGRSLNELQAAADSAQALYDALQQTAPAAPVASGAERCGPGTVTLTASGAPAGGAYRWYEQPTGPAIGGATSASYTTPNLTTTTTYFVSAVTPTGQESPRVPVQAVINTLPVVGITISGDTSFCFGDSVILTATGADHYLWSNNDTTASVVVRIGATFAVIGTNAAGCQATSALVQVTVFPVPPAPVLTATTQPGGLVLLTSDGGSNTQFFLNGNPVGTPGLTLLVDPATQSGVYTASVTNGGGCTSPLSAGVNVVVTGLPGTVLAGVSLAPNPTTADVQLTLPVAAQVAVFDALGRVVWQAAAPAGTHELPLRRQTPGLYVVRVSTADGAVLTRRVVKQ